MLPWQNPRDNDIYDNFGTIMKPVRDFPYYIHHTMVWENTFSQPRAHDKLWMFYGMTVSVFRCNWHWSWRDHSQQEVPISASRLSLSRDTTVSSAWLWIDAMVWKDELNTDFIDRSFNSQNTSHISPLRASYGMHFVSIVDENGPSFYGTARFMQNGRNPYIYPCYQLITRFW